MNNEQKFRGACGQCLMRYKVGEDAKIGDKVGFCKICGAEVKVVV